MDVKMVFFKVSQNSPECFPVNLPKFLRTLFLTERLRWLLLYRRGGTDKETESFSTVIDMQTRGVFSEPCQTWDGALYENK